MAVACSIRSARDGDADAISQVIVSALRQTNAKDYVPEIIARLENNFSADAVRKLIRKQKMFVAVVGQQIVGTASLDGRMVRGFFVARNAQGMGIGRRLMAEIEGAAREAGVMTLVVQSSVTAEQFYAKRGFRALRDNYYADERTVIMERALAPVSSATGAGTEIQTETAPTADALEQGVVNNKQHTYSIRLGWTGNRGSGTSSYGAYSRAHELTAPGKGAIAGSSDSIFRGDPGRWNPEELLLAALAACHQLWYLHLCADAGVVVQDYSDNPLGLMIEQPDGAGQFESVTLRPHARLAAGSDEQLARRLHDAAAAKCAIARSVAFKVNHEPTFEIASTP